MIREEMKWNNIGPEWSIETPRALLLFVLTIVTVSLLHTIDGWKTSTKQREGGVNRED